MRTHPRRRDFLRWTAASAWAGALGGLRGLPARAAEPAKDKPPKRPNIVFILTDDQRHDAMSCAGHPWLKTPHMDRLAREGVRFTSAFVTTSLCSPSRGSFLTGCYAHTHGVFTNSGRDPDPKLPTFPQVLQREGYETAFIGKWHMARKDSPRAGFDRWVSFSGQGRYYGTTFNIDGRPAKAAKYISDELTDFAIDFLRRPRKKPFLLYLSHKAVHAGFTPPKRHADLYRDVEIKSRHNPADRLDDKVPWGRKMPGNWKECIRQYMASVVAVDENLGRLLKTLEEGKILDETLIVFAGDNGYFHGEHGGLWDKRAAYAPSMRIPLLMRYPPLAKAGTRCGAMVLNIDLAPTLLAAAGLTPPKTMQGRSWLGVLAGTEKPRGSFLYEYFREGDRRFNRPSVLAVRTPEWKYIEYPSLEEKIVELYDMKNDPDELRSLAADKAHAGTVRKMQAELGRLKKQTRFRTPPRGRSKGSPRPGDSRRRRSAKGA